MKHADHNLARDAELVRRTLYGDKEAFGELVAAYQGDVYGLAYALVRNWQDAQDVAQEAFIRGFSSLDQLRDRNRFAPWMKRVTFSVAMNWMKAHRRNLFEQYDRRVDLDNLDIPDVASDPREFAANRDLSEAVLEAVENLPSKYRVPLTMFHLDGLAYRKVAAILDVPLGTAKALIHRARKQLKRALAAYVEEEFGLMVKKAFAEHDLPEDFAGKVIEGVPDLAWGRSGNTTFLGAFEAATANTDHPYGYDALLVYSGLGLRLRYVRRKDGRDWCTVGPVGQFPEEADALARATGWVLSYVEDVAEKRKRTVAAIDAGRCSLAYIKGDSGAIYGYENDGDTVFVRCYGLGAGIHRMPFSEVTEGRGPFFPEKSGNALPPREALIKGLKTGMRNWRRGRMPAEEFQPWRGVGAWEFCFGASAYEAWIADIERAGELDEKERERLLDVHGWMSYHLYDARLGCGRHLAAHADVLGERAGGHLKRAAQLCQKVGASILGPLEKQEAFLIASQGRRGDVARWTPEIRHHECQLLRRCHDVEAQVIAEIESALAS